MENFIHPKIKELITGGLWKAIMDNTMSFDEQKELIEETYKNLPQKFKDAVNKSDVELLITKHVTVEITTKKKAKILIADFCDQELVGTIIEVDDEQKSNLFYKQLAYGYIQDDGKFYCTNAKPANFCCDVMKGQFKFCDQHGMNCPDNFITHSLAERFYMHADNATYGLKFCPYCGTKHEN